MEVNKMAWAITTNIENIYDSEGLEAAQNRYRAWFINTVYYLRYKETVDNTLTIDNYGDCIVTE